MAKINKDKYYVIQGKDDPRPYIYKGITPPEFCNYDGKQMCSSSKGCKLIGRLEGFIKPGECKQLIMYTKDIKQ